MRRSRRRAPKLPPHVMVYFAMALALFADDDYEEVAARLTETLRGWDCWEVPTSGGITQARQRLGFEPLAELFSQVAVPVAEELTRGAFLGPWRLMATGGFAVGHAGPDRTLSARAVAAVSQLPSGRHISVSVKDCSPSSVTDALSAISAAPLSSG